MRINPEAKDIPTRWFNVIPHLDFEVPPSIASSGYPLSHHDLEPVSAGAIITQELERKAGEIPIPKEVLGLYSAWRPTALYRAEKFEKVLDTPARIFYKNEGSSFSGGHEMNTAVAQAYYAFRDKNVKCLVSATGNGEWGIALAMACNYFGLKCKVYMLRSSYEQKVYGRYLMEILGAEVVASPSNSTRSGRKVLTRDPVSQGSIGIALSEAYEEAAMGNEVKFAWGSVMNHVLLHQTIIGLEARSQLKRINVNPDIVVNAVGGGSGFGGLTFPFFMERKSRPRMIAVETAAAPSLTKGRYAYDYADSEGLAPLLKMFTLGHGFVPPGIRAGDMRYHGMSPLISALYKEKKIETRVYRQRPVFEAAIEFARCEAMIPSPESAYTIKAVMDEAIACKERKQGKDILFMLDANSNLDLEAFKDFVEGTMEIHPVPDKEIEEAIKNLPDLDIPQV